MFAAEDVEAGSKGVVTLAAYDRSALGRTVLADDPARPVPTSGGGPEASRPRSAGATGSKVSPCDLPQGMDLEFLVGDDPLESRVLVRQLLERLASSGAAWGTGRLAGVLAGDLSKPVPAGGNNQVGVLKRIAYGFVNVDNFDGES